MDSSLGRKVLALTKSGIRIRMRMSTPNAAPPMVRMRFIAKPPRMPLDAIGSLQVGSAEISVDFEKPQILCGEVYSLEESRNVKRGDTLQKNRAAFGAKYQVREGYGWQLIRLDLAATHTRRRHGTCLQRATLQCSRPRWLVDWKIHGVGSGPCNSTRQTTNLSSGIVFPWTRSANLSR